MAIKEKKTPYTQNTQGRGDVMVEDKVKAEEVKQVVQESSALNV